MNSELLETNVNASEIDATAENQEASFRALAESELLLIGGGGGDVIWG
jgi:hypothetical protein